MKKVSHMSNEDRQFVLRLLHITKDDFQRAFEDLAKSDTLKGKRRFATCWCELAELAYTESDDKPKKEASRFSYYLSKLTCFAFGKTKEVKDEEA